MVCLLTMATSCDLTQDVIIIKITMSNCAMAMFKQLGSIRNGGDVMTYSTSVHVLS